MPLWISSPRSHRSTDEEEAKEVEEKAKEKGVVPAISEKDKRMAPLGIRIQLPGKRRLHSQTSLMIINHARNKSIQNPAELKQSTTPTSSLHGFTSNLGFGKSEDALGIGPIVTDSFSSKRSRKRETWSSL